MANEVLFFGCYASPGHSLRSKANPRMSHTDTPWQGKLDGGLLTDDYYAADSTPTGNYVVAKKDGWTAISFWDRSGPDKRPGCNSTFLIHADIDAQELLKLAAEQWPELFKRFNFINFVLKPS